jgi:hypothetical protein
MRRNRVYSPAAGFPHLDVFSAVRRTLHAPAERRAAGRPGFLLVSHPQKDGLEQNWIEMSVVPRIIVSKGDPGEIRIFPAVDATIRDRAAPV